MVRVLSGSDSDLSDQISDYTQMLFLHSIPSWGALFESLWNHVSFLHIDRKVGGLWNQPAPLQELYYFRMQEKIFYCYHFISQNRASKHMRVLGISNGWLLSNLHLFDTFATIQTLAMIGDQMDKYFKCIAAVVRANEKTSECIIYLFIMMGCVR